MKIVCRWIGLMAIWVALGSSQAQTLQPVVPFLEGIQSNADGTYTAHFGYKNPNTSSTSIAVGTQNKFSPGSQSQGQPTLFLPGRQFDAFTVVFGGGNLTWTLNGTVVTVNSGSPVYVPLGSKLAAIVKHAPNVNGKVSGSLQQTLAEGVNLNSTANVTGDWLIPGTPNVTLNGQPTFGGIVVGTGAATPTFHSIILNSGSKLRFLVTRTNAATYAVVSAPQSPTGTRSVVLNNASSSPGSFSTLKDLTLNSNVGPITVPAGRYGNFIANNNSGFVLGTAGSLVREVYQFQNLTLNSSSYLRIVGPVEIVVNNLTANSPCTVGDVNHPENTILKIFNGGLTLNSNSTVYAQVLAPNASISINSGALLVGSVQCSNLTINSGGELRFNTSDINQPPSGHIDNIAVNRGAAPVTISLDAAFSDPNNSDDDLIYSLVSNSNPSLISTALDVNAGTLVLTFAANQSGTANLVVRATDPGGLTADAPFTVTVNAPPAVALTAPSEGQNFAVSTSIPITATANDPDGTVSKVEFFADSGSGFVKIGEDTSAPYSFNWQNAVAGSYTLKAVATDNQGASATSALVHITINHPPVASITSPSGGTIFLQGAAITIQATASDPDGNSQITKVEFFSDGTKIGEDTTAPYTFIWNSAPAGGHDLSVKVTDTPGASGTSAPVHIIVNQAPSVAITSPAAGSAFITGQTVTLQAGASDPDDGVAKVEFFIDGIKIGEAVAAPYALGWTATAGPHQITAKATDTRGAVTTSSAIPVSANSAPSVQLTGPGEGDIFQAPGGIHISAAASDPDGAPDIAHVDFYQTTLMGPLLIGSKSMPPYAVDWESVAAGSYSIFAVVTDSHGATGTSASRSFVINAQPSLTLTSPAGGAIINLPGSVFFSAQVSDADGTVSKVEFFANGIKVGEVTSSPFEFTWSNAAPGTYQIHAVATDDLGGTIQTGPIPIIVNTPPTIAISAPSGGTHFQIPEEVTLTATAADSDGTVTKVEYFADSGTGPVKIGEAASAPWTVSWPASSAGAIILTAKATDNHGAVTQSAPVSITLDDEWDDLHEDDVFYQSVVKELVIPADPQSLTIRFKDLDFDTTALTGVKDAFELALVDDNNVSVVPSIAPNKDGFFNITDSVTEVHAAGVTHEVVAGKQVVRLKIDHLPPGTHVKLIARLINNDGDTSTAVQVFKDVVFDGAIAAAPASVLPVDPGHGDPVDFSVMRPASSLAPLYGRTFFSEQPSTLSVDLTLKNMAALVVNGPVIVVINSISSAAVNVLNADGVTPEGKPYFNFTAAAGGSFDSMEVSQIRRIIFANAARTAFAYQLAVFAESNTAPVWTTSPVTGAYDGQHYVYSSHASDPDGDTVSYSLLSGPSGMSISSTGVVTWTAGAEGSYSVTLEARDSGGARSQQSYVLAVSAVGVNRPPSIVSDPEVEASASVAYHYQAVATDPDNDPIEFSLLSGPSGLSVSSTGGVAWTPLVAQTGTHPVVLKVSDGRGGVGQQSYSIVVGGVPGNHRPLFVSSPILFWTVSDAFTSVFRDTAKALDPDGDFLTYSITQGPDGAQINLWTGAITWTPQAAGTYSFTLKVDDGKGGSDTQSFTVQVNLVSSAEIHGNIFNDQDGDGTRKGVLIFEDNFTNGASTQWGNEGGNWNVSNGEYNADALTPFPGNYTSLPFVLNDFIMELDVNHAQDGGIYLRSTGTSAGTRSGVALIVGGYNGAGHGLYWHIFRPGYMSPALNESASVLVPGSTNVHLRVEVRGNTYAVYVNGATTPATTLVTSEFSSGKVGLYDFSGQTVDNVRVYADDPGLSGWTAYLDQNQNNLLDADESSFVTGEDGAYQFTGLTPGTYTVREQVKTGWVQTSLPPAHVVSLNAGQVVTDKNFANAQGEGESIRGTKWLDVNRNGIRDHSEQVLYSTDFQDTADPLSRWSLRTCDTTPGTATHSPDRFLGQFLNNKPSVSLNDLPAHTKLQVSVDVYLIRTWDGDQDFGPDAWGIEVDGQRKFQTTFQWGPRGGGYSNSQSYPAEWPGTVSNPPRTGAFAVSDLGYLYTDPSVSFVMDSTYRIVRQVSHTGNSVNVAFYAQGLSGISDESWGIDNVRISIPSSEPGLAGVKVYLDLNNNGVLDAAEPVQVTSVDDPSTPDDDETGRYAFKGFRTGSYTVREVVPAGYEQTFPAGGGHLAGADVYTTPTDFSQGQFVDTEVDSVLNTVRLSGTAGTSGNWNVVKDGGRNGHSWRRITWNTEPEGYTSPTASIVVEARASDDQAMLSSVAFVPVTNGAALNVVGRFIEVNASFSAGALQNYDAARDFSLASNANGTWSYGSMPTLQDEFALYEYFNIGGVIESWSTADGLPAFFKNTSSDTVNNGTVVLQPGQLTFHPGSDGSFSVLRWTAPAAGSYFLDSSFIGQDVVGTSTDVHVLINSNPLYVGYVSGFETDPQVYQATLELQAGDTLDFALSYGLNTDYSYDSTGVDVRINGAVTRDIPVLSDLRLDSDKPETDFGNYRAPNRQPLFTSTPPPSTSVGSHWNYNAEAEDADADVLTYKLISGPVGLAIDPSTGELVWEPGAGQAGAHDVVIRVTDERGGVDVQSFQVEVTEENAAPVFLPAALLDFTSVPFTYNDTTNSNNGVINDFPSGNPVFAGVPFQIPVWINRWNSLAVPGGYPKFLDIPLKVSGVREVHTLINTVWGQGGPNSYAFVDFYGSNGAFYRKYLIGNSDIRDYNAGPFSNSLNGTTSIPVYVFQFGDYGNPDRVDKQQIALPPEFLTQDLVHIRMSDYGGIGFQTLMVEGITAMSTSATNSGVVQAGLPFRYTFQAQDAENEAIVYAVQSGPAGLTVDPATGTVSWLPSGAQIGRHTVVLTATDPHGNQSFLTVTLSVLHLVANDSPTITSTPRLKTRLGDPYVYKVIANDSNGNPLQYSLVQKPAGMEITADGIVTWVPTSAQLGDHNVQLTVTDGLSAPVPQSFVIRVTAQLENTAPVFTSTPALAATVNRIYNYTAAVVDEESDLIGFRLTSSPAGMSIDPLRGILRWTPASSQLGLHTVTIQTDDHHGGVTSQTFALRVRSVNLPPRITSLPEVQAAVGTPYSSTVTALDPENDTVTYRLTTAPPGMTINSETGVLAWTPSATGQVPVEVLAEDGQGGVGLQTFTVFVTPTLPNQLPRITVAPSFFAATGGTYSSKLTAVDPEGTAITYAVVSGPSGLTIDGQTGQLTWTVPASPAVHPVTLRAQDAGGGVTLFTYSLRAEVNNAPRITSDPNETAVGGASYSYNLQAVDDDGDYLTFSLVQGPPGMTVDPLGQVIWNANPVPGTYSVTIRVVDSRGAVSDQVYTVTVGADAQAPAVTLVMTTNVAHIGDNVGFQVKGTDNGTISSYGISVNDEPQPLDSNRIVYKTFPSAGLYDIKGSAVDASGNTGEVTRQLRVIDPADSDAPFVDLNLANLQVTNGAVNTPTDIIATVRSAPGDLEGWRLEIGRADQVDGENNPVSYDADYKVLATGTTGVEDVVVGKVDPTVLRNGSYFVRVIASDFSGNTYAKGVTITVGGDLKLGRFTYAVTDLNIPLAGIPITITRVYDTLDAGQTGDFGYGWHMALREARVEESVPPADPNDAIAVLFGPAANYPSNFKVGTKVTLTNPEGRRVSFKFQPKPADLGVPGLPPGFGLFGATYQAAFVPEPGVYDKLEVPEDTLFTVGADGTVKGYLFGSGYNPDNYVLTTRDGTKYSYNQGEGLKRIQDRNNNILTYTWDGIFSTKPDGSPGASITFIRDGAGRILKIVDPDGKEIGYQYSTAGDLDKKTDQAGRENRYTYFTPPTGPAHYLDKLIDPDGHELVKTAFDAQGRLSTVTDAMGKITTMVYDTSTRKETKVDPLAHTTVTEYDERGNVTKVTNEIGSVSTTEFDANNNPTKITAPNGDVMEKTYDGRGNVLTSKDPMGHVTASTFDAQNNLKSKTDPLGRVTSYLYDATGNLTRLVDAGGQVTQLQPDALGRPVQITDALGHVTQFAYTDDPETGIAGTKPTQVVFVNGDVLQFNYDQWGRVTSLTDPSGQTQSLISDDGGMLIKRRDPLGKETGYAYNNRGELEKVTNALNQETRMQYDLAGRLRFRTDANGKITEYQYDDLGRLNKTIDPLSRVTERYYRDDGVLEKIKQPDNREINFENDINGRRSAVIDPNGNRTSFIFNGNNQVLTQTDPLGHVTTYTYNAAGNLSGVTDRNGRVRTFTYDNQDRLTAENWLDGSMAIKQISITYDALGNVLMAKDDLSTHVFAYDTRNRVQTETVTYSSGRSGFSLTYTYNNQTRTYTVTDQSGVVKTTELDPRHLLQRIDWEGGGVSGVRVDFERNDLGDITGIKRYADLAGNNLAATTALEYGRGLTDNGFAATAYNANGDMSMLTTFKKTEGFGPLGVEPENGSLVAPRSDLLRRITRVTHRNSANATLSDEQYGFDDAGQVTSETNPVADKAFGYDATGQLTSVASVSTPSLNETFTYDSAGNRLTLNGSTFVIVTSNRVESDGVQTYGYDNEGNLTGKAINATGERWAYTYDHRNRLTKAEKFDIANTLLSTAANQYDVLDRRVAKTVNGQATFFNYHGEHIWSEVAPSGEITRYLTGEGIDQWMARSKGVQTAFYLFDRLGSVKAITSANGTPLVNYTYTAFGQRSVSGDATKADAFGFTGREHEAETGLMYLRARYYDPGLGRFLSEDPMGSKPENPLSSTAKRNHLMREVQRKDPRSSIQPFSAGDYNLHRYVLNSPSNGIDLFGTFEYEETIELEGNVGTHGIVRVSTTHSLEEPVIFRYFTIGETIYDTSFTLSEAIDLALEMMAGAPPL